MIEVPVTSVTVPEVPPKVTVVSLRLWKLVPVMVTVAPPTVEPVAGEMVVMVGAAI